MFRNTQPNEAANLECLTKYVKSLAEPDVNIFLRNKGNIDASKDVECLDSLVSEIEIPSLLFRGIDLPDFSLEVGKKYCDPAFISTSQNVDVAFGQFARRNNSILLVIHVPSNHVKGINVSQLIGDDTYENEIILNRGTNFYVTSKTVYGEGNLFQNNSEYSVDLQDKYPEIIDITVYEISIVQNYYRPEWTSGRYNAKHHVALMYNLLGGVVHFFEDISADFISFILSTPRNHKIDYSSLLNSFDLPQETIEDFLDKLLGVGLLTPKKPDTDLISNLRSQICAQRHSSGYASEDTTAKEDLPLELSTAEMCYANALKNDRVITSAMFELTYRCSEKCIHCYNIGATRNDIEQSGRHLFSELDCKDYKRVIDELYEQGLVKVCLTGGDPFSKHEIWEIIEYLHSKEIAFDIFTNGQMLVGNEERLADLYPRLVGISIYSALPEVHDRITRIPGSLEKSMTIMEHLSKLAVPLNLKCCVMRPNVKSYRTVFDIAREYNAVPQIEVNVTDSVSGDKCVSNFLRLTEKEFNVVLRDKDVPLYVGPESKYFNGAERKFTDKACGAGQNTICLTPDGDIIPCCTFHYAFGNVRNKSISEILSSKERDWWLTKTLSQYAECARHDYCAYCNLCPGVNYSEHGTPLKAGSNNCFLAKIRLNLTKQLKEGKDPIADCSIDEALNKLPDSFVDKIRRI